MAEQSFQDKTEPATPKKREDARKKGQVAKSREISSVAILTTGIVYMFFNGRSMTMELGNIIRRKFTAIPSILNEESPYIKLLTDTLQEFILIILPIMIVLVIIAVLANLLQSGFILSVEPLTPKPSKIDPINGLTKSIFKIIIVGWAAFSTISEDFSKIMPLMYQEEIQIITVLGQISLKVLIRCCYVILILAILDYIYQKWEFEQNLKMTKQEVKDEFRQTEGDPLVKSRIKSIQREMARRRMMEDVPKADVVITNPTHLSIALQYGGPQEGMSAPRIVAKGANKIAFRIRELAKKHDIPIIENKSLAQNLYKLDIGDEIPPQFYQAVAEILAYVYGLKRKKVNSGY
jgi:flagellar biosynthetic protein FlhB